MPLNISSKIWFFVVCLVLFLVTLCNIRILFPWPGIEPKPPTVVAQSLNHCTAREVPSVHFLIGIFVFLILSCMSCLCLLDQIRSDQISRSVMSDSLRPHESQHARPPCPSPTPRVHSDSCPSSEWCHPAISSSVVPFRRSSSPGCSYWAPCL